jgi:bacillithiol synthase
MTHTFIPYDKVNQIAYKDLFYIDQPEKLSEFYSYSPDLQGLIEATQARKKSPVNRPLLVEVLKRHYTQTSVTDKQMSNIENLLNENTFTVVTAHQPCLLTGPAYYFYKIFSTVQLCTILKGAMPDCDFVPVFISGSEDHDFEETNHLQMFGKRIEWQTEQRGPVGRFNTDGLEASINEFLSLLGNRPAAASISEMINNAFIESAQYNEFVFKLLNELFGKYGLIVLNMDDRALKSAFIPIMQKELTERPSEKLVWETQEALLEFQYKPQAYPRDINLFYMQDQSRERIYFENNTYCINNTDIRFTEAEITGILHKYPERFSPNVVLRPVYQEFTLPDIAYIGGGGENAYWLERKRQFEYFGVFYPVIIRRNSALFITHGQWKQMQKLGLNETDIFKEEHEIITSYLESASEADFHLNSESEGIKNIFASIAAKSMHIDPTLEHTILGEGIKMIKHIESIEAKLKKALKQKEEISVNQIHNLKGKLFPANNLQERTENFFQVIATDGFEIMDNVMDKFNPLDRRFLIFFI